MEVIAWLMKEVRGGGDSLVGDLLVLFQSRVEVLPTSVEKSTMMISVMKLKQRQSLPSEEIL